uniref:HTH luxR-type domain-containing protein n=1 Tax=Glossina brevipalpis TaxID=37001 RepID=A0A1A9VZ18_9MUSC
MESHERTESQMAQVTGGFFGGKGYQKLKVLSLYCSGFNLQFIAEYLDIKINTVHVHMKNAMHKYNSTSYSELKAFFYFIVIGYIIQNDNVRVEISSLLALLFMVIVAYGIMKSLPRWTGNLRFHADKYPPWSLYKNLYGATFILNVDAMLSSGIPIEEALQKMLSASASAWLNERLQATLNAMGSGGEENLGHALDITGYEFPGEEAIIKMQSLFDTANKEGSLKRFGDKWLEKTICRDVIMKTIKNGVVNITDSSISITIGLFLLSLVAGVAYVVWGNVSKTSEVSLVNNIIMETRGMISSNGYGTEDYVPALIAGGSIPSSVTVSGGKIYNKSGGVITVVGTGLVLSSQAPNYRKKAVSGWLRGWGLPISNPPKLTVFR